MTLRSLPRRFASALRSERPGVLHLRVLSLFANAIGPAGEDALRQAVQHGYIDAAIELVDVSSQG
eukprot:SAG31_NODE_2600_length_5414_cov_3.077140_4_plen_65_part_00